MSSFDDRKKGFEKKFAHDEEKQFKINARKNKYLGEWASPVSYTHLRAHETGRNVGLPGVG